MEVLMQVRRTQALIAGAFFASVGFIANAHAASVAVSTSPDSIDGWTISWPSGVGLAISQDATTSTQVDIQKTATFTAPNQGFQITFVPTSSSPTANV